MLLSPYAKVGGLVWFPRMLMKIRLRATGELPDEYVGYLGEGFDGRCVRFLGVGYEDLVARVLVGGTDEEVLEWCWRAHARPTVEQIHIWNEYMIKRGWRDTDTSYDELQEYKEEHGLGHRADIETYFDFYEVDEGRVP